MERAGARPHLLTHDPYPGGKEGAHERGWGYEVLPRARTSLAGRARQHLRQDVLSVSPAMTDRLEVLGPSSAFIQLEEIDTIPYVAAASSVASTIVSLHNVDSQVASAQLTRSVGPSALRSRYRAGRMARAERRAASDADMLLCVSERDQRYFADHGAESALLIPNGVDEELFSLPTDPVAEERVLFFGAFSWPPNVSGAERFIEEAWPLVRQRRPAARLRVSGPRSWEQLGRFHAPQHGIEILGFVEDLLAELRATRVVVAPLWVGGGTRIKVLEAMAAGRPVVSTTVGVEQLGFEDGLHGLISDAPAGLADATVRTLTDDTLARGFAERGRAHVETQRWTAVTKPLEGHYRRLIAAQATPA